MRILGIETSTLLGGVSLVDGSSGLLAEVRLNIKTTHSERLMTLVDHIFKETGLKISDMDAFAVAIGPGSFTGLRIGLSTVKGFAYVTGRPIVAVPTLEALAWHFTYCRYPVCPMLDARKKEVFAALFKWEKESFVRIIPEVSTNTDNLLARIYIFLSGDKSGDEDEKNKSNSSREKIIFTGEGAEIYRKRLTDCLGDRAFFASPEKMIPSPSNVATLGLRKAAKGEFSDPLGLVPFYLRRSEAEIKWDG
ncbi:MAG: tRNA (adenosine(37)-N6)-threonylcarbamoyltransferase complex dimerization subunit type 1 TsaB [Nitrospirota bacterium]